MRVIAAISIALSVVFMAAPAQARHRHHHYRHHHHYVHRHYERHHYRHHWRRRAEHESRWQLPASMTGSGGNTARARRRGLPWCGAWMADHFGIGGALGRSLWLAANWAHMGERAIAAIGSIVVYPHHVAIITGGSDGHWIMTSGNDGHAVRTRPRSLRGAIAIRRL